MEESLGMVVREVDEQNDLCGLGKHTGIWICSGFLKINSTLLW